MNLSSNILNHFQFLNFQELQDQFSKAFGPISFDKGSDGFKHFGVDEKQDLTMNIITSSQRKHVDELTFITLPEKVSKSAECPADKIRV
jgi:hypothetical protein